MMDIVLTQGILIGGQERGRRKPPGLQGRATHQPIKRPAPQRGRAKTADSCVDPLPDANRHRAAGSSLLSTVLARSERCPS
ncbi:hypothetical protein BOSEA1005_10838 [Hyphomicrobiales bacterium]|nr:hypothetical protein BOSEA1005_10838 [Hyphomicrobiales bacterium]